MAFFALCVCVCVIRGKRTTNKSTPAHLRHRDKEETHPQDQAEAEHRHAQERGGSARQRAELPAAGAASPGQSNRRPQRQTLLVRLTAEGWDGARSADVKQREAEGEQLPLGALGCCSAQDTAASLPPSLLLPQRGATAARWLLAAVTFCTSPRAEGQVGAWAAALAGSCQQCSLVGCLRASSPSCRLCNLGSYLQELPRLRGARQQPGLGSLLMGCWK